VVLAHAIGSLQYNKQNGRVFNFVTRLHPGISRSQTRDCITPSPKNWQYHSLVPYLSSAFAYEHASAKLHDGIYLYKTKSSSVEWNYPFDLSGGVYCYDDVQMILKQILTEDEGCTDMDGLSHPNTFEIRGNEALLALDNNISSRKTLSAVPSRPLMVILAVNRVQDICQAPIAYTGEGRVTNSVVPNDINGVDPANPMALLQLLQDEQHLDVTKYQSIAYNSSHVGDLFLLEQPIPPLSSGNCYDLSVLIPVHRGVDFASHSVASIIMQCIDEENLSIQIVIVDDRCIDGSIDIMIQSCKTLLASQPKVALWVHDHRLENDTLDLNQQQQIQPPITIAIDIISSKSSGVAGALNTGLDYCKSEFVARMDADDVSTPKRLLTQLRFMRNNPSINVVGASAVIFVAEENEHKTDSPLLPYHAVSDSKHQCRVIRTSLSVSDPGFMSWAMLFTCAIAHPTVMFAKHEILEIGGYDTLIRSSEDYDLWLRLLEKDCHSMLCLPFVGVWHRKHNQSNSIKNSVNQKREANYASHRAIKQILSSTGISDDDSVLVDIENVSTLKDPDTATSLESINSAARLLLSIESSFIQKNAQCLTEHEISLIQNDCNSRIGELATIAITKFGKDIGFKVKGNLEPCYVWKMWEIRCPEDQFQRLSLLCHSNTSS
jgi:glycosyltransferase involved in cell wall biosynthesis